MSGHSDSSNSTAGTTIWQRVILYLMNQGFPGPLCSRIRVTAYANGTLGVERRYRFRWQKLRTHGRSVPIMERFFWSGSPRHTEARLPDTGQLNDAIGAANNEAVDSIQRKQPIGSWVLDSAADNDPDIADEVDNLIEKPVL